MTFNIIYWIVGSILTTGLGILGFKYYNKIDKDKIDIEDLKEIYEMTSDFIKGGEDNKIDASDALILLEKLQNLLGKNILNKEEIDDDFILIDLEELTSIENQTATEDPTL